MTAREHPALSRLPAEEPDHEAIRKAMALPLLSEAGAARIAAHIEAAREEMAAGKPAA